MKQDEIFNDIKIELLALINARPGSITKHQLMPGSSVWIAASLLQKAIRRGEQVWALAAARHLLERDPDRFWRRLLIIAYEDIGLGNLPLVAQATTAIKYRRQFEKADDAFALGMAITRCLANSLKCRAADDLFVNIQNSPQSSLRALKRLNGAPTHDLWQTLLNNEEDIAHRGIAMWLVFGTQRHQINASLPIRRGNPKSIFDALIHAGWPFSLVELCRAAFAKTGETICPFVALLQSVHAAETGLSSNTQLYAAPDDYAQSPTTERFGVPAYAIDYFTREGRRAYYKFMATDCETAKFIKSHIPRNQQIDALGSLVFRCESGLVDQRYNWPTGSELRQRADRSVSRMFGTDSDIIFEAMRHDLPLLNKIRAGVAHAGG